jgi:2-phosphosulfolactate phosphatase
VRVDVVLIPSLLEQPCPGVCVVVDALRATSTLVTLLARGVVEVAVTETVEEGRTLRASYLPDHLLCGEVGGLRPDGFDFGNSPAEFSRLDLHGRRVILATSNGTRALARAAEATTALAGSLLNRTAVARAALSAAVRGGADLAFLCAGTDFGRAFSLEDTAVCGAIIEQVVAAHEGPLSELTLTDSAMAAYRLWRSYTSARLLLGESTHGQTLARLGLAADLDFCAQIDRYPVVPRLERDANGLLVLRAQ